MMPFLFEELLVAAERSEAALGPSCHSWFKKHQSVGGSRWFGQPGAAVLHPLFAWFASFAVEKQFPVSSQKSVSIGRLPRFARHDLWSARPVLTKGGTPSPRRRSYTFCSRLSRNPAAGVGG